MHDKRPSLAWTAAAAMLALGLVGGCRCNPNVVEPSVLAPRLLLDGAETQAFVEAFPKDKYQVVEDPAGKYWIDQGPDIIKNELRAGKEWEPHVAKLLREHVKPGTTVLDVGAHIGTHTVLMGKLVGKEGRVYAFEPQKAIFRELSQNARLNGLENVVPLRFAVGAEPGVIEMNPSSRGNSGGTSIGHGGDKAELRTLDSFGFKNVSVAKIDVEGFEAAVIDGAKETIARNKPVLIIEILGHLLPYDRAPPESKAQFDAFFKKLEGLGYATPKLIFLHDYLVLPKKPG